MTHLLLCFVGACQSSPCENNATCVPASDTSFTCSCDDGFTGVHCESEILQCDTGYLLCDHVTHTHLYEVTASSAYHAVNYGPELSCLDNQPSGIYQGKHRIGLLVCWL